MTTVKPELSNIAGKEVRIIIGSFDKSPLIRQLVKTGKLDGKELRGKNEKYIITTLHAPLEGLQGDVLLIAGSDKRGTIYGIYELSKQIGISPWYWWLDVPPVKHQAIYIKEGVYTDGEPAVNTVAFSLMMNGLVWEVGQLKSSEDLTVRCMCMSTNFSSV